MGLYYSVVVVVVVLVVHRLNPKKPEMLMSPPHCSVGSHHLGTPAHLSAPLFHFCSCEVFGRAFTGALPSCSRCPRSVTAWGRCRSSATAPQGCSSSRRGARPCLTPGHCQKLQPGLEGIPCESQSSLPSPCLHPGNIHGSRSSRQGDAPPALQKGTALLPCLVQE